MKAGTFMHALFWCCKSCGFVYEGGQPTMECPICEAYKASFVSTPGQIQSTLIDEFGEGQTNTTEARARRLELLREKNLIKRARLNARTTEAVHRAGSSRREL